ncbi:hypothetical protein [Gordonia aichiensis]|nr:hypothetical protein [Gordonia aichiensis]
MGVHYPAEPDFNAATDDDTERHSGRRQLFVYLGVTLSLVALLVILLLNM